MRFNPWVPRKKEAVRHPGPRPSRGMGARVPRPLPRDEKASLSSSELAAAVLIFALATVVLSYPLAFSPVSLSRLDNGDARLNAWAMSWVAHQLVREPLELFDANTFYPLPRSLAYSEHLTVQGIMALPLLAVTNDLVLTNNLVLLFAMFASALGMYLLAFSLTRSHLAAILAGLLFSFAPFRFNRLPHIQMQLYAFIPLFLAALHRYVATRRARWLVGMTAAFVLQALSGTYLGAIASVALGIALVALLPYSRFSWRELSHVAIALVVMALVLVPFALPYMWVHRELGVEWDLSGLGSLSATPKTYLASSSHLYRTLSEAVTTRADRTDYLFPGLTLLVLGVAGLVTILRDPARRRIGICYAGILVAGIVLSFGPFTPVYPFLYEHVVFFRGLRALTRFGLLPLLSLSVFSAFALARLFEGSGRFHRRKSACAAIGLFFVFESTALPYRLAPHRDEPPEVYTWLRDHAKPGPFVELPFKVVDTRYMFWARHHDFRPTLNGDSGFIPMSHQWMKIALSRFPSPDAIALLRRLSVRYVVLHLGAFRARALPRLLSGLEEHRAALLPIRDFGTQTVYEVVPGPGETGSRWETLTRLPSSGSEALLFDGNVDERPSGTSPELEIDVELAAFARVEGFRFHYGPVPRAPVSSVEVLIEDDDDHFRTHSTTPDNWPAVTELVSGLLETPLDGTQIAEVDPVDTRRLRLRLRGIDGARPDITEIEVLGSVLEAAHSSRLNTGN